MGERSAGEVTVRTCGSCQGIFLDRADLGRLVEA
jgi:Zn-finger nucleic acid-binding protein